MKALLMHPERDFDWQGELPPNSDAIVQDLGLDVLFKTMARGDDFLFNVAQRAVLRSHSDPEVITHRQQVWLDCHEHPEVVQAIYDLTVETLLEKRKIFSWFGQWPEMNLHHGVEVMQLLVRMLRRLRAIAEENSSKFQSPAFRRFFAMLLEELDDSYFEVLNEHLERLKFSRGVLISAKLGKGNSGADFVLRRAANEKSRWSELILGPRDGRLWFDVHPRDEAGHQALAELRNRGINLVADALSQSSDHVLAFLIQLRAECAFYIGCLNLRAALDQKGALTCLPEARPVAEWSLSARGLYDVSLALTVDGAVVDNDVAADGSRLVVITGANQGGKSTFLRSIGLAQLMMEAGMFVGANDLRASVASGLFTHFKREEDETMASGKLDEELGRMSRIVDHIQSHAVLLCNESFASTNEREGADIGEEVIGALNDAGVKVVLVTHLFDLAERLRAKHDNGVLFLRAERLADGTRTFKVREGEALPTSFGKDLYDEIFGGRR